MSNDELKTQAMVCPGQGEPLVLQEITLPPMTATMVEVDIEYCGLCHTDIHMKGTWRTRSKRLLRTHFRSYSTGLSLMRRQ
jgi:D-arabinose 1-dehydrogenase-like Zn-dependent alcohol dehydrogenase